VAASHARAEPSEGSAFVKEIPWESGMNLQDIKRPVESNALSVVFLGVLVLVASVGCMLVFRMGCVVGWVSQCVRVYEDINDTLVFLTLTLLAAMIHGLFKGNRIFDGVLAILAGVFYLKSRQPHARIPWGKIGLAALGTVLWLGYIATWLYCRPLADIVFWGALLYGVYRLIERIKDRD
jgi:hypothetical protein